MAFTKLLIAGLLEIFWAFTLGKSDGFTHPGWGIVTIIVLLISLYFLESVVHRFGVGITYAVFTGIGTAGTAILDLVVFHEPTNIFKFISLIVLLIGIVGLKLTDKEGSK